MLSRTARRLIFYAMVLTFIIGGGLVIAYAQGFRIDLQTFSIKKIGAIYIRTFPSDAQIFVNGKPIVRPFSLFESGVLINDLFPKTYTVTAARDGYKPWTQHAYVDPSMVDEFKTAVLVPDQPQQISADVSDFWIIKDTPLILTSTGTLVWQGAKLPGTEVSGWTSDGNVLLTHGPKGYYVNYLSLSTSTALSSLLRGTNLSGKITDAALDDADDSRIILRTARDVILFALPTRTTTTLVSLSSSTTAMPSKLASSRSWISWSMYSDKEKKSVIHMYRRSGSSIQDNETTLSGRTEKMTWLRDRTLAVLQDDRILYLLDPNGGPATVKANEVRDFVFSPDGSMLATLENQSVEVFTLNSDRNYWRLNLPNIKEIKKLLWYADRRHLFVVYPEETRFLSLEDRPLENIIPVAKADNIAYIPGDNAFFYLSDTKLLRLNFPQ